MTGWGKRRSQRPHPGQEYASDDSLFDVVAWREDLQTRDDEKTQERSGQDHVRVFDPVMHKRLGDVLELLTKICQQLAIITDEEDV